MKEILDNINIKFQEGKINFFFYILSEHKPIGLEDNYIFNNPEDLENFYNLDKKKFMKKMRRLYNPLRYKGKKKEDQKVHSIMQEISMKLNDLD